MKSLVKILILLLVLGLHVINGQNIKVISPNGGELLSSGERYGISWISEEVSNINIYYSIRDNEWKLIAKNIPNEIGHYGWRIPDQNNANLKIKISSVDGNILDISDNNALIKKNTKLSKVSFNSIKIMPLGNSITYDNRAGDGRNTEDKIGYRFPLYNLLNNAGYNFEFIGSEHSGSNFFTNDANAGFPGIKDHELAHLLQTGQLVMPFYDTDTSITPGPYLSTYSPDIVLLHIGTNGNNELGGTNPDDVEDILDEIKWYEDSSGNEVTIFLARIIDRVPNDDSVTALNNNVVSMALDRVNNPLNDAYPDKIVIVDMQSIPGFNYTISPDPNGSPGDMNDFLHPNDNGYSKMANVWFDSLSSYFDDPLSIVLEPSHKGGIVNDSVSFKVVASGNGVLDYQWKKNNVDISGANDSVYTIQNISLNDNNSEYFCAISNSVSTIDSRKVKLFVSDEETRVSGNQLVLYNFEEGEGGTIGDSSKFGDPLNLDIFTPANTKWVPYGLEVKNRASVTSLEPAVKIFESCELNNEITIEVWILPQNNTQDGPARIITFSQDGSNRNFTVGQSGDMYSSRLLTTETDNNGLPSIESTSLTAGEKLTHLVFTRNSEGNRNIYVNGLFDSSDNISGDFSNWDSTYHLGIANEFNSSGSDRYWTGTYYLVSIFGRALSESEINHNYDYGFNGKEKLLLIPTEFTGYVEQDTVVYLNWQDNDLGELGYIVERKENSSDSNFVVIDSLDADITEYIDDSPKYFDSYFYRVKAFNEYSSSEYSDTILVTDIVTNIGEKKVFFSFQLDQNYPNPFNPTTKLSYSLADYSEIQLEVFNLLGEKIITLIDKEQQRGKYYLDFDGSKLSAGLYILVLNSRSLHNEKFNKAARKMILLK